MLWITHNKINMKLVLDINNKSLVTKNGSIKYQILYDNKWLWSPDRSNGSWKYCRVEK